MRHAPRDGCVGLSGGRPFLRKADLERPACFSQLVITGLNRSRPAQKPRLQNLSAKIRSNTDWSRAQCTAATCRSTGLCRSRPLTGVKKVDKSGNRGVLDETYCPILF